MSFGCVVLDFDGTFTDVVEESRPFQQTYKAAMADLLGRDIALAWEEEARVILRSPEDFGWEFGGKVVAPATADPYLLCTAVAQRLFDRFHVLKDREVRTEISQALYRTAYKHTATAFRPEAKEVAEGLLGLGVPVFVVTNSHTDAVAAKIDRLAPKGRDKIRVIGDAKKYVIAEPMRKDRRFELLDESARYPGLRRPVLLRRGHYFDVLHELWQETGAKPEETLVCGDIFELDLALPAALGCAVHLVARANTLAYEHKAIESLAPRGAFTADLTGLLARVRHAAPRKPAAKKPKKPAKPTVRARAGKPARPRR